MQRFDGDMISKIPAIVFLNDSAPLRSRSPRKARLVLRRVSRRVPPPVKAPEHMRVVIEASVGQVFGVLAEEFGMVTRGRARIAFARQIAMYLSHVACGQSLTDVGASSRATGQRWRMRAHGSRICAMTGSSTGCSIFSRRSCATG